MDKFLIKCSNCGTSILCDNIEKMKDASNHIGGMVRGIYSESFINTTDYLCDSCKFFPNIFSMPSLESYVVKDITSYEGVLYLCSYLSTKKEVIQAAICEAKIFIDGNSAENDRTRLAVYYFNKRKGPLVNKVYQIASLFNEYLFVSYIPSNWRVLSLSEIVHNYLEEAEAKIGSKQRLWEIE